MIFFFLLNFGTFFKWLNEPFQIFTSQVKCVGKHCKKDNEEKTIFALVEQDGLAYVCKKYNKVLCNHCYDQEATKSGRRGRKRKTHN